MKLNVGDIVTVETEQTTVSVNVEDASKGDIIRGKVEKQLGGDSSAYSIGGLYEFDRKHIKEN